MTNFDFLLRNPHFSSFSTAAVKAEHLLHIDVDACVLNCRRALESAVKWIFSVDQTLDKPKSEILANLLKDEDLRQILGEDLWRRADFIRKVGNKAAHEYGSVTEEQAVICLENLFEFMDFVAYCYGEDYEKQIFYPELLELTPAEALSFASGPVISGEEWAEISLALKEEMTSRRRSHQLHYVPTPLDLSQSDLRKVYREIMVSGEDDLDENAWLDLLGEYDA
ncbi:MAG: DUF4145 domain-containing protein [Lachnospiraceae bacterium]|nr:DUF4145 domain-containing protein [Lachnospiraceae bacterium]